LTTALRGAAPVPISPIFPSFYPFLLLHISRLTCRAPKGAASNLFATSADKPRQDLVGLFRRLSSSPALTVSTDTPLQVALENEETHVVQTLPCGSQLCQDINAISDRPRPGAGSPGPALRFFAISQKSPDRFGRIQVSIPPCRLEGFFFRALLFRFLCSLHYPPIQIFR